MPISPTSRVWVLVREIEDRMALVGAISLRRGNIENLALYEGSYDQIFDEAVAMADDVDRLRQALGRLRDEVERLAGNGE